MKTIIAPACLAMLWTAAAPQLPAAQTFTSGSDGSYGPMNITTNTTLDLPADGIFHCTTVNVAAGARLRFNRNALNTPVYLLATGDVSVNGIIDVSGSATPGNFAGGAGGPGGFDGGGGGFSTVGQSLSGGAGLGPGGGKPGINTLGSPNEAGAGAYGTAPPNWVNSRDGQTYGSPLLIPMLGGSGGGGVDGNKDGGGGGGGGALLISSTTIIRVNAGGAILSRGGAGASAFVGNVANGGSGGAIRMVAPRVYGTGTLNVLGAGYCGLDCGGTATGGGRIRIDSIFTYEPTNVVQENIGFNFQPSSVASVGSAMVVFPPNSPRLDIVQAAGTNVPEGTGAPVFVELPFGADTNQTVTVQARNFDTNVAIRVVLTPAAGTPTSYDTQIDNLAANPAQATVNVGIPVNTVVRVNAWTR